MNVRTEILESPKIAATVSAMTTGTGAGTALDWIPDDIGKLGTVIGIILSVILIRIHLVSLKKVQFELKTMTNRERRRSEIAALRKHVGEPLRRTDDHE